VRIQRIIARSYSPPLEARLKGSIAACAWCTRLLEVRGLAGIWHKDDSGWRLLAPTGFPEERTLHDLVEETPQILPLAGDPRLVVIGKVVPVGKGFADLLAIEPSGRLAIIEIKLARNAEARRAVVAQVLTYAASLKGLDPAVLERSLGGGYLHGHKSLRDAVASEDQEGSFDPEAFSEGLAQCLSKGHFRLVLDEAPEELIMLVGYLESVTEGLLVDLVAVLAYEVNGSHVVIPQRVDAEEPAAGSGDEGPSPDRPKGRLVEGAADFAAAIDESPPEDRAELRRLHEWAVSMEQEGLVRLQTYHGVSHRWTLLPRLTTEKAGLVTIWNESGAYLQFWRSVFERRAPDSLPRVERLAPVRVGQGNTTRHVSDELLEALTDAYREAVAGKIGG
jgi:hypothetical protein